LIIKSKKGEFKMKLKKLGLVVGFALISGLILAGCGKSAAESQTKVADAGDGAEKKEKIVIGTGNAFKPYCYLDENGELQGYEKEVLEAVNQRLPQYEFVFDTYEFKNLLPSLDANKIQLASHQFAENEDRKAKYLFAEEGYTVFSYYITVAEGTKGIEKLSDLEGKKVETSTTSNVASLIEDYNKEHTGQIELVFNDGSSETTVNNLVNGTADAIIVVEQVADGLNKSFNNQLKKVGEPILSSETYFIYDKKSEKLQKEIDQALKEIKADGTLSKISEKVLGGDYTKAPTT